MTAPTETIRSLAGYLEQWLAHQGSLGRVPGIQAAVRVGEEVVLNTAWGVADVSTGTELTTEHLFRIASHSKTFTGTAIMQLVEAGSVRLDDRLQAHIPELAGAPIGEVTVREALGHQGGIIRDGKVKDFWQRLMPFPDRQGLLAMARDEALTFGRNEHFKYSNVAYALLGLVIETAAGTSYDDYVRTRIIDVLGLTNTGPEYDPDRHRDFVLGHTGLLHGDDVREPIEHVDSRAFGAATGFYSTAADMTTYGAAHFHGDDALLSDDSKRLMQRLESVLEGPGIPEARYGVGMSLRRLGDRDLVGHSGGYPGHITRTYIDPTDQIVVSVLTNAIDGPADALAAGIFRLIDLALDPPAHVQHAGDQRPTSPTDTARATSAVEPSRDAGRDTAAARYTGRFAGLWGISDIVDLGGHLYLLNPAQANPTESYLHLRPVDADTARIQSTSGFGSVGELVHYERDDDGTIVSLRLAGGRAWPVAEFLARRAALARGRLPQD